MPGLTEVGGFSLGYLSSGDLAVTTEDHDKLRKYKEGDVVGCGLNSYSNEIFFTLNGELLPKTFPNLTNENLFPTVGLSGVHSSVTVNFGRSGFLFDIDSLIKSTKSSIINEILSEEVRSEDVHFLIKNHLEVHGFPETLAQFEHRDEDTYKSFLVHRQDFKHTDLLREYTLSLMKGSRSRSTKLPASSPRTSSAWS